MEAQGHKKLSLGAAQRIKSGADFRKVYDQRQSLRNRSLTIYLAPRESGSGPSRLGLSVSRRHGNAVRRNRIKRVLREIFRLNQDLIGLPYDLILIPQRSQLAGDFATMNTAFRHLARKIPQVDKKNPS